MDERRAERWEGGGDDDFYTGVRVGAVAGQDEQKGRGPSGGNNEMLSRPPKAHTMESGTRSMATPPAKRLHETRRLWQRLPDGNSPSAGGTSGSAAGVARGAWHTSCPPRTRKRKVECRPRAAAKTGRRHPRVWPCRPSRPVTAAPGAHPKHGNPTKDMPTPEAGASQSRGKSDREEAPRWSRPVALPLPITAETHRRPQRPRP